MTRRSAPAARRLRARDGSSRPALPRNTPGGYSNREIAQAFGTAEGTVKNQVSSILSKLGVRARTRAALKALELSYL